MASLTVPTNGRYTHRREDAWTSQVVLGCEMPTFWRHEATPLRMKRGAVRAMPPFTWRGVIAPNLTLSDEVARGWWYMPFVTRQIFALQLWVLQAREIIPGYIVPPLTWFRLLSLSEWWGGATPFRLQVI